MAETKEDILQDIVRNSIIKPEDLPPPRRVKLRKKALKKLRKSLKETEGSDKLENHINKTYSPGNR